MAKQTKLQELNRQRGKLIYKFKGVKAQIQGLKLASKCSDMMYAINLNASTILVDEAFCSALDDIDRRIFKHKEFLYKSGARCSCGNRKLEISREVAPIETVNAYCGKCGNKWTVDPYLQEQR